MTSSASTSLSSVDFADLLVRVDDDHELAREILLMFKEEYPALMNTLEKAVAGREMYLVKTTAHTLKGMLANLSVVHALSTASLLEQLGEEGDPSDMDRALVRLRSQLLQAERDIDLYLEEECADDSA